jgi:TonB-dependent receptor
VNYSFYFADFLDRSGSRFFLFLIFFSFLIFPFDIYGQEGILKGKVSDASANSSIFGVSVSRDSSHPGVLTAADGYYLLKLLEGTYTIHYRFAGFQTKSVSKVRIVRNQTTFLDINLSPIAQSVALSKKRIFFTDSVPFIDTVKNNLFFKESRTLVYHAIVKEPVLFHAISSQNILPGTDKNTAQLLKRLNGVVVLDQPFSTNSRSLVIGGMGSRYNQVLLNGVMFNSTDPVTKAYPLELLPVEAIEDVSVTRTANASVLADFAGGTIKINTKDLPDRNFFYIQAGGGFADKTKGEIFYGDKRGKSEVLSFPGTERNLPSAFPTSRSRAPLSNLNVQEKFDWSKQLTNNLAPVNQGSSAPNTRFILGMGKLYKLKKGARVGLIAFLTQQKTEEIDQVNIQVTPDVVNNKYPFSKNIPLVGAYSNDIKYKYLSQLGATVNATVMFGRNKISFKNFFGNQLLNHFQQRNNIYKPDEDTLAGTGLRYLTEQRSFWNTQLIGQHALGNEGKLKINWTVGYTYYRQQNPDERNFLLRQDSANKNLFALAKPISTFSRPQTPTSPDIVNIDRSFTNSGRLWRNYSDHNIVAALNVQLPFNLFNQPQVFKGGLYMQSSSRIFYSDLYQVTGGNFTSKDNLLSSDRYFPGGTIVESYFVNYDRASNNGATDIYFANGLFRGNYTASSQLGASYLQLESRLAKTLSVNWGLRLESNNQLTSSSQYEYLEGFKKPRLATLDENANVIQFDLLPSVQLRYQPLRNLLIDLSYSKTVNRPQLQELAAYRYYDAATFMVKTGNPYLSNSNISNYEAKLSFVPFVGSHFTVSGFYKNLDQPIENIITGYATSKATLLSTPFNTISGKVTGISFSFDTKLNFSPSASWLDNISLFGDIHLLKSEVEQGRIRTSGEPIVPKHSLTGSPDYTINAGIVIKQPKFPALTLLYNETADYISALGSGARYTLSNGNTISAIPDYRVKGRRQMDIQVSQQLFKSRIQIIVGAHNLLGADYIEYQDLNGNEKFDSPLTLTNRGGNGASGRYFQSGVDNTVIHVKAQKMYYVALSYLFK